MAADREIDYAAFFRASLPTGDLCFPRVQKLLYISSRALIDPKPIEAAD